MKTLLLETPTAAHKENWLLWAQEGDITPEETAALAALEPDYYVSENMVIGLVCTPVFREERYNALPLCQKNWVAPLLPNGVVKLSPGNYCRGKLPVFAGA